MSYSVIIPAYRAAATLPRAIESALTQTVRPLEILVVDDCSPDNGAAIAGGYPVTVVRRASNGGEAAAKNTGVQAARGNYVALLDADDAWEPRRLEAIHEFARTNPGVDLITTDALVEVGGQVTRTYYGPPRGPAWTDDDQRALILNDNFIFSHVAMPRALWTNSGGMDESDRYTGADWPFWVRLLFSGARAGLVTEPLARYCIVTGSLSDSATADARTARAAMNTALGIATLSSHERSLALARLAIAERQLRRVDALQGVWRGAADRSALVRVAIDNGYGRRQRAEAALAAALPAVARRRMTGDPDNIDRS